MIVLHASFPIRSDRRDQALVLVEELVQQSRAEDGMLEYRATTDVTNQNVVRFFERYEDEAAFEAHTETDHFQEFEKRIPDFLDGEPEVLRFDVDGATELDL